MPTFTPPSLSVKRKVVPRRNNNDQCAPAAISSSYMSSLSGKISAIVCILSNILYMVLLHHQHGSDESHSVCLLHHFSSGVSVHRDTCGLPELQVTLSVPDPGGGVLDPLLTPVPHPDWP